MFETVGVMAVSACILQMVYEKIEKQRPVVDYTEENRKNRKQKSGRYRSCHTLKRKKSKDLSHRLSV